MHLLSNSAIKMFAISIAQLFICRTKFLSVKIRSKVVKTFVKTVLSPFLATVPFDIALPSEFSILVQGGLT